MNKYKVVFYGIPDGGFIEVIFNAQNENNLYSQIRGFIRQRPIIEYEGYKVYPIF